MRRRTRIDSVRLAICLSFFFRLQGKVLFQSIEPGLPEVLVLLKPPIGRPQRPRAKSANALSASNFTLDQPRPLQYHHVFRNRIERHRERLCDLADRSRPARQGLHNCSPCRIGHRRKHSTQLITVTFNHTVECYMPVDWGLSNLLFTWCSPNL